MYQFVDDIYADMLNFLCSITGMRLFDKWNFQYVDWVPLFGAGPTARGGVSSLHASMIFMRS